MFGVLSYIVTFVFSLLGVKQRMPIRAEDPHVGTDPVSVRLHANSVYRPHNIFPHRPGADRHGVCPYMRASARVGDSIKPNSHISIMPSG